MTRLELLSIARRNNRQEHKTYKIDSLARQNGLTVVRLPPYHCFFNPIELTWAFTKNYVATNNLDGKLQRVGQLFKDARQICIRKRMWEGWDKHVRTEEDKYWTFDKIIETVPNINIHVGGDSDDEDVHVDIDSSDESEEEDSDVEETSEISSPLVRKKSLQQQTLTVPTLTSKTSKTNKQTTPTFRGCLICNATSLPPHDQWRGCDGDQAHWYHLGCLTRYI